jgi:hypothetical protein
MCSRRRRVAVAMVVCAGCSAPASAQDDQSLRLSGYYKNLLLRSETFAGEPYTLDLNRLRLELKGQLAPTVSFDVQYDNEVLLGSYLQTAQFQVQKSQPSPQYWSLQSTYVDRPTLYGVHGLYRAQLQVALGDTDVRIGRQRIAWGTGRFWSPIDLLNPFSPVALEPQERLGVDAVLVDHKFGPVSRLAAVYAPSHAPGEDSGALQWHDNARGVDFSFTGGRFSGDDVIGVDLAGQIGQAGVRAELTRVRSREGKVFARSLVGIDYAFANTLTMSAELYHDGSGADSPDGYDFLALVTGARQTLAQHYFGLHAGYEITPLLKFNADIVLNLDDHSRFISPSLTFSIRTNLDGSLAVRWFSGPTRSEYAGVPDGVYLSLQWFF